MQPTVLCTTDDGVATIILNRPERRNAVTRHLMWDLIRTLEEVDADPTVHAVILAGAGGDFCVGRDHASDSSTRIVQGKSADADRVSLRSASRVIGLLVRMQVPTIAVIRGGCAGGGLSLALACDFRIAAADALFNSAFVAVGFPGDLALPWLLTRVLGTAKAREVMLLPQKLTSAQAHELGLVTEVVDRDILEFRVDTLARRLARSAPAAIRGAKLNLESALHQPLSDYLVGEVDRLVAAASTADAEEARLAFLEKRPARFLGR